LDLVASFQDKELRRLAGDLEVAKKELEKTRREAFLKIEELKRLESGNVKIQNEKYELRVEEFENQLRDLKGVRKEIQHKLEYAGTQWEIKLKLFVKDSDTRAKQSLEHIRRIKELI
jgi:hypothetical protein